MENENKKSCLIEKLSQHYNLNQADIECLSSLEDKELNYSKGDVITPQSSTLDKFFIIKEGWVAYSRQYNDGERVVISLKLPGDIIGLHQLSTEVILADVIALTDATLCPVPFEALRDLFRDSKTLPYILFGLMLREGAFSIERVAGLGKIDSAKKIATYILLLAIRMKDIDKLKDDTFPWPISQSVLGDLLGISAVHINRSLQLLKGKGFISYTKSEMSILDRDGMESFCNFNQDVKKTRMSILNNDNGNSNLKKNDVIREAQI